MDILKIQGQTRLQGDINVSGSKNAALPIVAATLLASGKSVICNVPDLSDIRVLCELLTSVGADAKRDDGSLCVDATVIDNPIGEYDIVRRMRASICILGPLLARCGRVEISMPGGCAIGDRPVDIHLRGLEALGAKIEMNAGYIIATAPDGLVGKEIFLGGPFGSTVLGTANVMMAATLAKGTTIIESAACEPEISDLANMLNAMGAKITGIGAPRLVIEGVKELNPVDYTVMPDRIEAGTFMAAAAITRGELKIKDCPLDSLMAATNLLRQMGAVVEKDGSDTLVAMGDKPFKPAIITTQPYPGFPTDLQAQFMTVLSLADGNSVITEKIFPDRFMHVAELNRMAASLRKEGPSVIISGVKKLIAAPVMASDLRASAAMVIAGLAAHGETVINRVYHIDRGYEQIEKKLNAVGANIVREKA